MQIHSKERPDPQQPVSQGSARTKEHKETSFVFQKALPASERPQSPSLKGRVSPNFTPPDSLKKIIG